jgi:RNA polymerase sigma factor (sigma-70 family)
MDIAQLVGRSRRGDSEAFGVLVRKFQNAGYAIALGFVRNPDDAEDVLQDAFITAYCRLGQLREPAAFPGWFRSVVVTQCRGFLRQRNSRQRCVAEVATDVMRESGSESNPQDARIVQRRVWEQVFGLPEPHRSAALLFYLSDFSQREIAAFLQVPLSTVNGRLQQARLHLRQTLNPVELEDIEMSKIDVSAEVEDAVYQIATEPVREVVDLQGRDNVVLFCGVNADIEVRSAEGPEMVVEGSRVSMGLSPEEARDRAGCLQIRVDEVEDFEEVGPHPGELFTGTNRSRDEVPKASTCTTADFWSWYRRGKGNGVNSLRPSDLFPDLGDCFFPFPEELKGVLQRVVRVGVVQDEAQDLVLPSDAYRPKLHKVFRPNASDVGWMHGPVGYVSLSVMLPPGKNLTVIRADEVVVRDVSSSVYLVECKSSDIQQVRGDVYLLDTPAEKVSQIEGRLYQRFYSFGGMNWQNGEFLGRRWREFASRIEDIAGGVDLDVGRINLELARLKGDVNIVNRYGETRYHVREWSGETKSRIESACGSVHLFLHEDVIADLRLTIATMCGSIGHEGYRDLNKSDSNSTQLAVLTTLLAQGGSWNEMEDADVLVKTESGDVRIEKIL